MPRHCAWRLWGIAPGIAAGALPGRPGNTDRVDGRVGLREGAPLFGSTSLVFDGPGQVSGPLGTDRVTFTGLEYEVLAVQHRRGLGLDHTAADLQRITGAVA